MLYICYVFFFFFSSRRQHTRLQGDWSSDVCSSDLIDRGRGCSILFGYLPQHWPDGSVARSQETADSGQERTFSSELRALSWFVGPLRTSVFPCTTYTCFCSRSGEQPHSRSLWGLGLDATIGQKLAPDSKAEAL